VKKCPKRLVRKPVPRYKRPSNYFSLPEAGIDLGDCCKGEKKSKTGLLLSEKPRKGTRLSSRGGANGVQTFLVPEGGATPERGKLKEEQGKRFQGKGGNVNSSGVPFRQGRHLIFPSGAFRKNPQPHSHLRKEKSFRTGGSWAS